jgi:hypothetical protein
MQIEIFLKNVFFFVVQFAFNRFYDNQNDFWNVKNERRIVNVMNVDYAIIDNV